MKGTINPIVKICCISSVEEAFLAIDNGAAALGLVGHMPSGPGVIDDAIIRDIAIKIPTTISSFLLTSETYPQEIIRHHKRVNTNTIQIVDYVDNDHYKIIKDNLPSIKLVQVVHVLDETSIDEAVSKSKFVDAILLDSGNPNLEIKELGGTGRIHNWEISKTIREEVDIPIYLAGGLTATNVKGAIDYVQPFGIDLCSGVRNKGNLSESKLKELFKAINNA